MHQFKCITVKNWRGRNCVVLDLGSQLCWGYREEERKKSLGHLLVTSCCSLSGSVLMSGRPPSTPTAPCLSALHPQTLPPFLWLEMDNHREGQPLYLGVRPHLLGGRWALMYPGWSPLCGIHAFVEGFECGLLLASDLLLTKRGRRALSWWNYKNDDPPHTHTQPSLSALALSQLPFYERFHRGVPPRPEACHQQSKWHGNGSLPVEPGHEGSRGWLLIAALGKTLSQRPSARHPGSLTHRNPEIANICCLKLVSLGMICYAARDN